MRAMEMLWAASLLALGTFFVGYPLGLFLISRLRRPKASAGEPGSPRVSLLIVVRNGEAIIEEKIRNSLALDYPHDRFEVVVCSDGSTDRTDEMVESVEDDRLRVLISSGHRGKIALLNDAMKLCTGEIVVFSDADALLDADALRVLLRPFEDSKIGGVCGQRIISRERSEFRAAQQRYIGLDSTIKRWETRLGSITSNDGKLYAIRRELFRPIRPAVSDDMYVALGVVEQHRSFVFEPHARAWIRLPSRSPGHETQRRRRIVAQSFRSMFFHRALFNPLGYGWFAVALATNKVLRRLVPVFLITLFASSLALSGVYLWMIPFAAAQTAFYAVAGADRWLTKLPLPRRIARLCTMIRYFVLGQYGTLLGVIDFLTGRSVTKWDPIKTDEEALSRS